MTDKKLEQQLVKKAKKGDRDAFDALMLRYQHKIIVLVNRYIRDPNEALDVTQEVFIKALRALPKFRGDSTFYTWLYRIAINTAKNHLLAKGRKSVENVMELDEIESKEKLKEISTPERLLIGDELIKIISSAMNSLPEDLRMVIILREIEGLSYDEIAEQMDCPVGTVRSRIFRAREVIFKKINDVVR